MKLVSFRHGGRDKFGVALADGIVDLTTTMFFGERMMRDLREVLAADAVDELRKAARGAKPDLGFSDVTFLLPVPRPGKILCVGRNYRAYHEVAAAGKPPEFPSIFGRLPESFVAHGEPIVRPAAFPKLDYEGELAVVIGRGGRRIAEAEALAHVAGYACLNEGSVRDWQGRGTQNFPSKNFDASGSIGPWIATADELPDPAKLRLRTRVNGEVRQDGTTDQMIFDVPFLISYVSQFTRLEPGDILATGSPGGSAIEMTPPRWLAPGDRLEVEIAGVGTLENSVVAE
jgi:5-carboxymethyl-2-hydroxymuconate isomerase